MSQLGINESMLICIFYFFSPLILCLCRFLSELEEHGGLFVKENRLRKGYMLVSNTLSIQVDADCYRYDVPDESLDTNVFKTRDFIQSSEKQPGD